MIVSNTTPISNLLHLNNISLLAELFGTVYIPEAVANELNVVFLSSGEWQKCIEGALVQFDRCYFPLQIRLLRHLNLKKLLPGDPLVNHS